MTRIIDRIKEIIKSDQAIVPIPDGKHKKQKFFLCQCREETIVKSRPVKAGSYLLVSETLLATVSKKINIAVIEKEPVVANVLHYLEGAVGKLVLDDSSADLTITDSLTGCTVAKECVKNKTILYHLNFRQTDQESPALFDSIHQEKIDAYLRKNLKTLNALILRKEDYSAPEQHILSASTFMGFKNENGTWEYYNQISRYDDNTETYTTMPASILPDLQSDPKLEISPVAHKASNSCFNFFTKRKASAGEKPAPLEYLAREKEIKPEVKIRR